MKKGLEADDASDGRLASCGHFRILFGRRHPNWSLSAALGKATIGERIPLLPDYKSLILRYYSELWNAWSTPALEELISRNIVFRGSIGTAVNGIGEFKQYVNRIRAAFPDFHNHIEELISEDDKVVARLTYTGRRIVWFFRNRNESLLLRHCYLSLSGGKIVSGHVLGDTESLKRQIAQV
jgi:predicted ester cyclase